MPTKISSREVLDHLNELGFNNITSQQLKEFIYDLKKLVKHEEQKKLKTKNHEPPTPHEPEPTRDVFTELHEQGTVESRAKITKKKESVICVQIRNKPPVVCSQQNKENVVVLRAEKPLEQEEPVSDAPLTERKVSSRKSEPLRPKSSFIRPILPVKSKSDPVALYHRYQTEWKKHKLPGEDNRTDLRWAIRERMLGGRQVSNK